METPAWPRQALFALLLVLLLPAAAAAQDRSAHVVAPPDVRLDADARARVAAAIRVNREAKVASAPTFGKRRPAAPVRRTQSLVDIVYTSPYVDTQAGTAFAFPEDAHDFCRAEFDPSADQDYTVATSLQAGATLSVQLDWAGTDGSVTDFDLYLFDRNGRVVGDPAGLLPEGGVGDDVQTAGGTLTEQAFVTTGAADEPVFAVVDRFRGTGVADLTLTFSGDDGVFVVEEYVGADFFTHIDAVLDTVVGPLTEGAELDLDAVGSPRPNFNAAFNTDGCARSVVFTLTNQATGETITFVDDDAPFALFGDTDGDFTPADLAGGLYTLSATPFAGTGGQGAAGAPLSVDFSVVSNQEAAVSGFTLIDADTDTPIAGYDPIADGAVLDLTALPPNLNIRANTVDPRGEIGSVVLALARSDGGTAGDASAIDDTAPYSLFGDAAGDFAPGTLALGAYVLTGTPFAAAGGQGTALTAGTVAFTVIGPRIGSYTLIDADTELPVPGFDPIPEGSVLNLAELPPNLNIRANTVDPLVLIESVKFTQSLDGTVVRTTTERARPYALFGDFNQAVQGNDPSIDVDPPDVPNYGVWRAPLNGAYTLEGIPYSNDMPSLGIPYGPLTLSFSVIGAPGGAPALSMLLNYPNPFNPVTTIRFMLDEPQPVSLRVFDMLGREVRVLLDGPLDAGLHEVPFDAGTLASGLYLYRLETAGGVRIQQMTLTK